MFRTLLAVSSLAIVSATSAAPLNLVQTVTRDNETITLRLTNARRPPLHTLRTLVAERGGHL
ncbi:MAG: hypothetical protein ACO3RV_08300 [Luteolibacter sp.]